MHRTGPRKLAKTLFRAYQRRSETLAPTAPVLVETTSPSEQRTPDKLPARPKLVRSHTTSESRSSSNLLSPKQSNSESTVSTQLGDVGSPLVFPDPPASELLATSDSPSPEETSQPVLPQLSKNAEATAHAQSDHTFQSTHPAGSQSEPLEFLLVDDNAINLKILSSYMKKLNYKYNTASNGQEAVDTFIQSPAGRYSCVFMDISMPVMDGFEATRRIRTFERETRAPKPAAIFALSGLASADAQKEAFASGIDLFLSKPVKLKELSSFLESRGLL